MLNVLWWLITVEALGLAVFPLAFYLLRRLPDRGFSVTKPLGILLVGYIAWILGALNIVPAIRVSLIIIMVLVIAEAISKCNGDRDMANHYIQQQRRDKDQQKKIDRDCKTFEAMYEAARNEGTESP